MTSPLHRKRPTTARTASTPLRTAASAAVAALLLAGGLAPAQQAPAPAAPTISFHKPAQPPAPGDVPPVRRTALQQPPGPPPAEDPGEARRYRIQLDPPGPQRLFQLESERNLQRRMIQEGLQREPRERIFFPDEPVISRDTYQGRHWPVQVAKAEPTYVCHPRLLFEQRNAERYGWDFGIFHPLISAGVFVADVVTLPYHVGTAPCRKYECSAGLCLPGDPVPLLCSPPELSFTGALTQAAAVVGLMAVFP